MYSMVEWERGENIEIHDFKAKSKMVITKFFGGNKMKKLKWFGLFMALCMLVMSVSVFAATADGTCGENLTWTLTEDGVLTISGTGSTDNYIPLIKKAPWSSYTDSITSVVVEAGVTGIGNFAFSGCKNLVSVTLNEGLTSIGSNAFLNCSSLKEITFPAGFSAVEELAFSGCSALEKVVFPESLTKIGISAFLNCKSLNNIVIPSENVSFGGSAFIGCSSLTTAGPIGGGYGYEFAWTTTIPEKAFERAASLTTVTIPATVTSIGDSAFSGCSNLTDVYYEGKVAEWSAITVGSGNDALANATVHCSDSDSVTNLFVDVYAEDWFVTYVQFVYDRGLMSGSDGQFRPNENMTRAMMVTTLYRMSGSPEVTDYTATEVFYDVEAGAWYEDAVNWAYNTGITTGYEGTGKFGSEDDVTREQLAVFLYRYAGKQGFDTTTRVDISGYVGADQVSDFAQEAMEWAVGIGLISGIELDVNGEKVLDLAPQGSATRGQLAAILTRFCGYYGV